MIETPVSLSPTFICPRACSSAMRAETAVPVGERSILAGWIETTDLARSPSASCSGVPAKRQKEWWRQSGFSGWLNRICRLAASMIRTPRSARSRASSTPSERPSATGSTTTKLSPP